MSQSGDNPSPEMQVVLWHGDRASKSKEGLGGPLGPKRLGTHGDLGLLFPWVCEDCRNHSRKLRFLVPKEEEERLAHVRGDGTAFPNTNSRKRSAGLHRRSKGACDKPSCLSRASARTENPSRWNGSMCKLCRMFMSLKISRSS